MFAASVKHIGCSAFLVMVTGSLWVPAELQHTVRVTRTLLFIAFDPLAAQRSSLGMYERDSKPRYNSPVLSTL